MKLYTRVLTHPKWLALTPRARAALVQAWMWVGAHETDGAIVKTAQSVLDLSPKVAAELCENGWLEKTPEGWFVHDWSDHQETREKLMAKRESTRRRVARHRTKTASNHPDLRVV